MEETKIPTLTEISNVQEIVWDMIHRGEEMDKVVDTLETAVKENNNMLNVILANYYVLSDITLNMPPEELHKLMSETAKRRQQ